MASPQIENGFTRIANELMEALYRTDLSGTRLRLMLYVMRESYGYRRTSATFTYGEIASAIGIKRQHAVRDMTWLVEHNYLGKNKAEGDQSSSEWSIQKDYMQWGATKIGTTDNLQDAPTEQEQEIIGSTRNGTSTSIGTATKNGSETSTKNGSPHTPYMEERNLKKESAPTAPKQKTLGLASTRNTDPDGNLDHPMVLMVRQTLGTKPTPNQRALIVDSITNAECWQDTLTYWQANNYRTDSIGNMITRYKEQLPKFEMVNGKPKLPKQFEGQQLLNPDGSLNKPLSDYLRSIEEPITHATFRRS